jgi:hypothetical protein
MGTNGFPAMFQADGLDQVDMNLDNKGWRRAEWLLMRRTTEGST